MDSADTVIAMVGEPRARWWLGDVEHWLYDNARLERNGKVYVPEVLFRDRRSFRLNWVPETQQVDAIVAARAIAGWRPPAVRGTRGFTATDRLVLDGRDRTFVVRVLGEPDSKRVVRGREVWDYEDVRLSASRDVRVTFSVDFVVGVVVSTRHR